MSRQNGNGNGHQQMSNNEAMTIEGRVHAVLQELDHRGPELAGVLPRDLPLVAFLANVNQALRANPKLLRCTFDSIINACVRAAYDGLRIDGKEAAIVDAEERYKDGNVWKSRSVARYMPMVYGLIKQILDSGAALTVKAVVVYRNELYEVSPITKKPRFMLIEGTTPGIYHEPIIEGDKGKMVGAYAMAEVQPGVFKFDWMDAAAIEEVRKEAKTDKVWDRWPTEMWKKTVIRRIRKSLNGTSQIRDMEANEMFPQFDRATPHPQLAQNAAPRPTRAAIGDQRGTESGVPLDLGQQDGREVVERQDRREDAQQERQQDAPREQQQREPEVDLPGDAAEWDMWASDLKMRVSAAASVEEVDEIVGGARAVLSHAPKPVKDKVTKVVTERNTAIALGE